MTMAENHMHVNAPPETVFDVLADAESYGHWVVGASEIRDADSTWPEPGATFHHTQGAYGRGIKDTTTVVASNRPRQLVMIARARPLVVAKVELRLRPSGRGTHVTMVEYPVGALLARIHNPVIDWLTGLRNQESLRRLRRLAEERDARTEPARAAA